MNEFLGLIVENSDGYSGLVPELTVMTTGDSLKEVQQALSEGITLYLRDQPDTVPHARKLADLDAEIQADYDGLNPIEVLLRPAPMNPISVEIERAIKASPFSYRELARQMGTGHAAISRMADPFYWGHSVTVLRKLATILNLGLDVNLVKPIQLPSGSIIAHHFGGTVPAQVRLAKIPELDHLDLPTIVQSPDMGTFKLESKCEDLWQNDKDSVMYYGYPL